MSYLHNDLRVESTTDLDIAYRHSLPLIFLFSVQHHEAHVAICYYLSKVDWKGENYKYKLNQI